MARRAARHSARAAWGLLGAGVLAGCAPSLDWREVRPDGWSLRAALPCRPERMVRPLSLAGTALEMTLLACSADGYTFGLASAPLSDPAAVGPVLQALGAAARANVQGAWLSTAAAAGVPGMTPQPAAQRGRLQGRLPDGQAVTEEVAVFSHGLRVYQATLVGPAARPALVAAFFDPLKIEP